MSQITVTAMNTDAAPNVSDKPNRSIARWRIEAFARAWDWSRRAGIPYSPFVAVKAL